MSPFKGGLTPLWLMCVFAADLVCSASAPPASPSWGSFSADQLDRLTSPIALYPDPLIALILPSSTTPGSIATAASYLKGGGLPTESDLQPWPETIRALAHYPEVVQWMDANEAWVAQLGNAFFTQPGEVMDSIQRLRHRALAAGKLASSAQVRVIIEGDSVLIEPADTDVLYVPIYDADTLVSPLPYGYGGPFLTFGQPYPIGVWLNFDCDWMRRCVWVGNGIRNARTGWRNPGFAGSSASSGSARVHVWRPDGAPSAAAGKAAQTPAGAIATPQPISGANRVPPAPNNSTKPLDPRFNPGAQGPRLPAGSGALPYSPGGAPQAHPAPPYGNSSPSRSPTGDRPSPGTSSPPRPSAPPAQNPPPSAPASPSDTRKPSS